MDVVIGIAMTSRDARLLLVEGAGGDGAVIDHGSLDVDTHVGVEHPGFRERVVNAVIDARDTAPANGYTVTRVALTWTDAVAAEAGLVLDALDEMGIANEVVVSTTDALEAAAEYTVRIADCDSIALCVVEPDETLLAVVGAEGDDGKRRVRSRHLDGSDEGSAVLALCGLCDSFPERVAAIAIAGSAPDAESLVEEVNSVMPRPVVLGDDAALLLARGAVLAGADIRHDAVPAPKLDPLMRTLTTVMATAVLILAGAVFLALTVQGSGRGAPTQASTPAEHAAPVSPAEPLLPPAAQPGARDGQQVHTVACRVSPWAAGKPVAAPCLDIPLPPLPRVVRR
ncbi:hypothetical protein VST63_02160 [Mycolicibacterium sp. 050232]|uniref:DUF7159 family protein n=1 Tax=Mycolicibacterium sp. 050232 TaxID=3113982 RepID=UPI002E29C2E6|nr:hypothetical protein [Mycolicibacterium sp. 050232]MED5811152.1 hypothetical protein [Mycolicibacterium sp. 050232]